MSALKGGRKTIQFYNKMQLIKYCKVTFTYIALDTNTKHW